MDKNNRRLILTSIGGALLLIIIILVIIIVFRVLSKKNEPVNELSVKFQYPKRGMIYDVQKYTGTIEAMNMVTVTPKASGTIKRINIKVGDNVKEGAVIGEIERDIAQLNVDQAEANFNLIKSEYDRTTNLYKQQMISQSDYDQLKAKYDITASQLKLAELNLDYTYIKSPISGIAALLFIERGQTVGPSVPVCTITDIDTVKLKINIPEKYYSIVKDQKNSIVCYITPVSCQDKEFKASVNNFSPFVSPENRTFWIELYLSNADHMLTAGMYADVKLILNKHDNALLVPNSAFVDDSHIWIVNGERSAIKVEITAGLKDENNVEIISGVTEKDKVITEGGQFIQDNTVINTIN
jgi:RND family efflux transporter MFP subunit